MAKEKNTDLMVAKLLDASHISYRAEESGIKEIDEALKTASKRGTRNRGYPEFVGLSRGFVLVIEDKADLDKHVLLDDSGALCGKEKAKTDYAINGAVHYAKHISENTGFRKVFAFGASGDEKHHVIQPVFVEGAKIQILDPVETFENFSEENVEKYYREVILGETPKEVVELEEIIRLAKDLHEDLRNYGQLGETEKPLVVSAILLALSDPNFQVDSLIGDDIKPDGMKVFDALSNYLDRVKVAPDTKKKAILDQFSIVRNRVNLNRMHSQLGKTPLRYFTEFIQDNVYHAIRRNTPEDVLGRFYGEFVKYGGGDGQSLGIVLTPKHITELFCDLADIKSTDILFDPCCGTSGFLIAGMHRMINATYSEEQVNLIKRNSIFGIEIREDLFAIATTNMILRGDGKSNLRRTDFLQEDPRKLTETIQASVGFMNPPYSQAKGKDTAHLSELHFIQHLLDSLVEGGRACVIVPQSTMIGKTADDRKVKKYIYQTHTLEAVITLNRNTFYNVGTNPCIAVFTAKIPHAKEKRVKFFNFEDDGFVVSKHIGLLETESAKDKRKRLLDCYFDRTDAPSEFMVKTTIEPDDEWLHSFYYFNDEIPSEFDFKRTIADYLTFEFSMITHGRGYLFELADYLSAEPLTNNARPVDDIEVAWREFDMNQVFTTMRRGKRLKKDDHLQGDTPYISSTGQNNGVDGFISNDEGVRKYSHCLTIANSGSVGKAFYQPYEFIASDHVTALINRTFDRKVYLFLATIVSRLEEKYSFNRELSDKRIRTEKILLPVDDSGSLNLDYMRNVMIKYELEVIDNLLFWYKSRRKKLNG